MIEITHIQAQVLRGLLIRSKNLLATVESADRNFSKDRDAAIKDCESYIAFLLKRMQECSPALTQHYADNGDGK